MIGPGGCIEQNSDGLIGQRMRRSEKCRTCLANMGSLVMPSCSHLLSLSLYLLLSLRDSLFHCIFVFLFRFFSLSCSLSFSLSRPPSFSFLICVMLSVFLQRYLFVCAGGGVGVIGGCGCLFLCTTSKCPTCMRTNVVTKPQQLLVGGV